VKKLFEKTMMVALGSESGADDAGVSAARGNAFRFREREAGNPGVDSPANLAARTGQ